MNRTLAATFVAFSLGVAPAAAQPTDILNVSYDISRELFEAINQAYVAERQPGLTVNQSHAGSSAQARSILEGFEADVVTFNQVTDIETLVAGGAVSEDWASEFPNNASPYYSLPAFLVRAGNPKGITGWADLVREDVQVIFPNPKTSGNARYTYLAARAYAEEAYAGDTEQVEAYLTQLFANVPVFDTGGRAATTTFVEREIGDVLITFEAEVHGIAQLVGADRVEPVVPEVSLLAEFPVAIVDRVVDQRGSREIAEDYLDFLYSPEGQTILAQNFNRVHDEAVVAQFADQFPPARLIAVEDAFGTWAEVTEQHFADGGLLDRVFLNQ